MVENNCPSGNSLAGQISPNHGAHDQNYGLVRGFIQASVILETTRVGVADRNKSSFNSMSKNSTRETGDCDFGYAGSW